MTYPTTYLLMKGGPCHCDVCKHDGDCEKCDEYGDIRLHAAKDHDEIFRLRKQVAERDVLLMEFCNELDMNDLIISTRECRMDGVFFVQNHDKKDAIDKLIAKVKGML